jgi:hypothetical protein
MHTGCWWENLTEEDHLKEPAADERIILKRIFEKWDRWSMDWIDLAQDWGRWQALLNAVMNLRVP